MTVTANTSRLKIKKKREVIYRHTKALLMELVDVVVLGTIAERRESSSLSESKKPEMF